MYGLMHDLVIEVGANAPVAFDLIITIRSMRFL